MLLLSGLGNPGREYGGQRHNIGFRTIDAIHEVYRFRPWKRAFQGEIAAGEIHGVKVLLLKPQTYMNESGRALREVAQFYKLDLGDIVVFHDELDLPAGKIKVKRGGGHAGHNGLRSIDGHCGNNYRRVRLGIGHPGDKARVIHHVLNDFSKADEQWLVPLLQAVAVAAPLLVTGDDNGFAARVTQATTPEKPANTRGSLS